MWGKQDFALPWFAGFEALSAPSWSMSSTNMSHCVGSACCWPRHHFSTRPTFPATLHSSTDGPCYVTRYGRARPPPSRELPRRELLLWVLIMAWFHPKHTEHTTHDPPDYGNNLMLPPNGLQQQRKPWMQKACNCPLLVEIFTEKPDTWGRFGLWESLWRIHRALEHRT